MAFGSLIRMVGASSSHFHDLRHRLDSDFGYHPYYGAHIIIPPPTRLHCIGTILLRAPMLIPDARNLHPSTQTARHHLRHEALPHHVHVALPDRVIQLHVEAAHERRDGNVNLSRC